MSRTKQWAWGAVIAALCSLAFAKAPGVSHGVREAARYSYAATHSATRDTAHASRTSNANHARSSVPDRNQSFAGRAYDDGFNVYRPGMHRVDGASGYLSDGRGRMQYTGGAIKQVSAESRSVPRPPPNGAMRSGSIRADVARYNEERGSARAMQRPADDQRPPESSPYRN